MTPHVPVMVDRGGGGRRGDAAGGRPARRIHRPQTRRFVMLGAGLGFLLLIGTTLIADGFGVHVPRGYVYAAMGFSALVEAPPTCSAAAPGRSGGRNHEADFPPPVGRADRRKAHQRPRPTSTSTKLDDWSPRHAPRSQDRPRQPGPRGGLARRSRGPMPRRARPSGSPTYDAAGAERRWPRGTRRPSPRGRPSWTSGERTPGIARPARCMARDGQLRRAGQTMPGSRASKPAPPPARNPETMPASDDWRAVQRDQSSTACSSAAGRRSGQMRRCGRRSRSSTSPRAPASWASPVRAGLCRLEKGRGGQPHSNGRASGAAEQRLGIPLQRESCRRRC